MSREFSPAEGFRTRGAEEAGWIPPQEPGLRKPARTFLLPHCGAVDCAAASSLEPDAAAAFWEGVTSGRIRLTDAEDRITWDLRAAAWPFARIAQHIIHRRHIYAAQMRMAWQRRDFANAVRWRNSIRAEHQSKRGHNG